MRLSMFDENDRVLLVGEGNFSFSVALFRLNLGIDITATCYETDVVCQHLGEKNIEYLRNNGVRVLLGVDATNLRGQRPILGTELFDKIIFNFPHAGGKMRIERNRELLRRFFISASDLLKTDGGQALVTLCNGQGGTLADDPRRRWDDSWKITEMAAHGNFVLTRVEPFLWSSFQSYVVTGYRSLDKQFHSAGALTHVFVKVEPPNIENIAPKEKINTARCYDDSRWNNMNRITDKASVDTRVYTFDITFAVKEKFSPTEFYTLLYNYAGRIIKDVNFIGSYKSSGNVEKRTYRISYKSDHLPLYRRRVIDIHENLIGNLLEKNLNVSVSR